MYTSIKPHHETNELLSPLLIKIMFKPPYCIPITSNVGLHPEKWTHLRDFETCRIAEQLRLRRDCAFAQSRQSLRYSHTQTMEVDERSLQDSNTWSHQIAVYLRLKYDFTLMREVPFLMGGVQLVYLEFMTTKCSLWSVCLVCLDCASQWNSFLSRNIIIEPRHEISNNVVCATILRAVWSEPLLFAWILYNCLATDWTSSAQARLSLHLSTIIHVVAHIWSFDYILGSGKRLSEKGASPKCSFSHAG